MGFETIIINDIGLETIIIIIAGCVGFGLVAWVCYASHKGKLDDKDAKKEKKWWQK